MAKQKPDPIPKADDHVLRPPAESAFAHELAALEQEDKAFRPTNWRLSPMAVRTYIMGGKLASGTLISAKYIGHPRIIEAAIATLLTDRALLLVGVPGTAKTWVSEHLAAAISGTSSRLIQGTAGLSEDALRYSWNYARLLKDGPIWEALVPSPVFQAMEDGAIVRVEELTRIPSDVQDSLITVLSEKILPVPELRMQVSARPGFNLIATANDRDRGINELSSALRRRFNTVVMPLPATLQEEVRIVEDRVRSGFLAQMQSEIPLPQREIVRLVTIFRELRGGRTEDTKEKLKSPSATLSTAEAISTINQGLALALHFGSGVLSAKELAYGLETAVVKDPGLDSEIWREYRETIIKNRPDWKDLYEASISISPAKSRAKGR
ncbi:MAG: AAA family ATPase [Saprospiraceae bacterium]|nr:AAA family ATPase [Saprospiraceae bacterium]